MAVHSSRLLPQGLLLCLLLSPALSAHAYDTCVLFNKQRTTMGPPIKVSPAVYASNTHYEVTIPVNNNTVSVYLRALDKSYNSVGTWRNTSQEVQGCKGTGIYNQEAFNGTSFRANWLSPSFSDVAKVKIQVVTIYNDQNASYSSLWLDSTAMTPTMTLPNVTKPTMTSQTVTSQTVTSQTVTSQTRSSQTNQATTRQVTTTTGKLTTNISFGNKVYSSPISSAIQILFVFLISRLLF
ncbi:placenta-expressed transcript 1 protein [Tenrec ecaudatus]|uniref:placenta-expressed transcript 1 protein n=1 Tax=Tenrec ecaudatus TaxID=94439 RepID=UPI003F5A7D41